MHPEGVPPELCSLNADDAATPLGSFLFPSSIPGVFTPPPANRLCKPPACWVRLNSSNLPFSLALGHSHFFSHSHASVCISALNSCGVSYIRVRHLSGMPAFL